MREPQLLNRRHYKEFSVIFNDRKFLPSFKIHIPPELSFAEISQPQYSASQHGNLYNVMDGTILRNNLQKTK